MIEVKPDVVGTMPFHVFVFVSPGIGVNEIFSGTGVCSINILQCFCCTPSHILQCFCCTSSQIVESNVPYMPYYIYIYVRYKYIYIYI